MVRIRRTFFGGRYSFNLLITYTDIVKVHNVLRIFWCLLIYYN